jgi:methionyl-tRNA formyltransferase
LYQLLKTGNVQTTDKKEIADEVKKKFKLIFMGTPAFAVPALEALHQTGHTIACVLTQPDRPQGRGRKVVPSPVKSAALTLNYPVLQPAVMKSEDILVKLSDYKPDFFVVVAFGHILPERLLNVPYLGAINIHASLLPKYRGPAPIQWAIINGEKKTGITTMLLDRGMDTGNILMQAEEKILPDDTAASLHDRLARLGADLLMDTLDDFAKEVTQSIPQDHSHATYAPMLTKHDGHIDWNRSAESLETFIRGVTPWPGAFTFHGDKRFKIFKAAPISMDAAAAPGTVLRAFPDELRIATGKGALSILQIQGASGKRLTIKDFLRGYHLPPGDTLA